MKITHLTQNTDEWLKFREDKIGASDIPAIMGSSPWMSAEKLIKIKTGEGLIIENSFMQIGKEKEEYVRSIVSRDLETYFEPAIYVSDEHPDFMASLDGISSNEQELIEIKVVGLISFNSIKCSGIPLHYYHQMQWQMMCSNVKIGYFISFCHQTEEISLLPVTYNTSMVEELIQAANKFILAIQEYKMTKLMPENLRNIPEEWLTIESKLEALDLQIDQLKKERDVVVEEALAYTEKKPLKGIKYSVLSFERKGSFDEEKLKCVINDLDSYRKPSAQVLTLKRM